MKMAKASERDIDAAGAAMGVLQTISSGYYPGTEDDAPLHFDPEDPAHLSLFYRLMVKTLDASPGWPGRVIGGMCYVILYDKNQIVDPDSDTLELHPRFAKADEQDTPRHRSADTEGTGLMSPAGVSPAPAPDLAALLDEAHRALTQLAGYADGFSVSGVYLNETADGKQAIADAFAAISRIDAVRKEKP